MISAFLNLFAVIFFFFGPSPAEAQREAMSSRAPSLRDFQTDGCSRFPEGTLEEPNLWAHCCILHDVKYWMGGTSAERRQADFELYKCVAETGHEKIAKLMHAGVRIGGINMLPTTWRWGYGWNNLRKNQPLTLEERRAVARKIPSNPFAVPMQKHTAREIDLNLVK